ncbi:MAG: iron donor protein CyaY [Bdellovibrionia bacterium]
MDSWYPQYSSGGQGFMEGDFRKKIDDTFKRIELPFDAVDPDIAECEMSMGSMTITLSDGSRCILSTQPSVNQLWLALAAKGTAYHFNYDSVQKAWMDDKGRGVELVSFLETYLKEATGLEFKF